MFWLGVALVAGLRVRVLVRERARVRARVCLLARVCAHVRCDPTH